MCALSTWNSPMWSAWPSVSPFPLSSLPTAWRTASGLTAPPSKALPAWHILAGGDDQPARRPRRPERRVGAHSLPARPVPLGAEQSVGLPVRPRLVHGCPGWREVVHRQDGILRGEGEPLEGVRGPRPGAWQVARGEAQARQLDPHGGAGPLVDEGRLAVLDEDFVDGDAAGDAAGEESVTVKVAVVVPLLPSATVTSLIERPGTGLSSFTIVPTPWPSSIVAKRGSDRFTKNVSSGS